MKVAARDIDVAVVFVYENTVPTKLIKFAVLEPAVFSILENDGSASVNGPVTA